LVPKNWSCCTPAKAHLDTEAGPLHLDLRHAAYGMPVTATRREQVEQELRELGCQRAGSPPAGTKPPRRSEVWQRSIPDGTPLQAFGQVAGSTLCAPGPDKPLLLTDATPDERPQAIGFLAAAAAERVAGLALVGILAAVFVVVSGYAFVFR
jgi:hypothetical protein